MCGRCGQAAPSQEPGISGAARQYAYAAGVLTSIRAHIPNPAWLSGADCRRQRPGARQGPQERRRTFPDWATQIPEDVASAGDRVGEEWAGW